MKQQSKEKLAKLIKQLRGGSSQRTFAKLLGVSFASIQSWENGDAIPSFENLSVIANQAGYTLQGLIDYLEDRPNSKVVGIEEMIVQVRSMPPRELRLLDMAVSDRLYAIAESAS